MNTCVWKSIHKMLLILAAYVSPVENMDEHFGGTGISEHVLRVKGRLLMGQNFSLSNS